MLYITFNPNPNLNPNLKKTDSASKEVLFLMMVCSTMCSTSQTKKTAGLLPRLPSSEQLGYQARGLSMFVHFLICTFVQGGCEQSIRCRDHPAKLFDPPTVDTDQWARTAVALGAKEMCLTSKYSGSFAMFQTNHTQYGMLLAPYQGGRGDVVLQFVQSCRKHGLVPCLYFIT